MTHVLIIFCFKALIQIIDKVLPTKYTVLVDNSVHLDFNSGILGNIVLLLIVSIVIFISIFTYKYIEVKGQEFGKKILNKI